MLTTIEKTILLQGIDLFDQVPSEQLAYLAAIATEETCLAGDLIYSEDDQSDSLYLVLDGLVELHRGGEKIATAGELEPFGTWALFSDEPRVVTATAADATRLLKIMRVDFVELLADNVTVTQGVLKAMVRRVRSLMGRVDLRSDSSSKDEPGTKL